MSDPQSPSQNEPIPQPHERSHGVNIEIRLRELLAEAGLDDDTVLRISGTVIDEMIESQAVRDEVGRVWVQLPIFDGSGGVLPFDSRNVASLEHTAAHVLLTSPEAAAVFAGVVYPSSLSAAQIDRFVWLGRGGDVTSVPDIFNSLHAINLLNEAMFIRLQARKQHEQEQLQLLLAKKKEAYEQGQAATTPAKDGNPPGTGG